MVKKSGVFSLEPDPWSASGHQKPVNAGSSSGSGQVQTHHGAGRCWPRSGYCLTVQAWNHRPSTSPGYLSALADTQTPCTGGSLQRGCHHAPISEEIGQYVAILKLFKNSLTWVFGTWLRPCNIHGASKTGALSILCLSHAQGPDKR